MTTMLLIRHAANDWVGERLAGWTPGVHLNTLGHQQAQGLADRLAHTALQAIYSSPLDRARETAAPWPTASAASAGGGWSGRSPVWSMDR
ncbi:MAG: histidine phosphatase family protein [Anaerolineae bacterium]|nr:MAG: histidine phosphatase family protein [Anaerolineae bacterium]